MPILDIQKRARELGRIRLGQVVPTRSGKTRPEKLDRFRLTSASKPLLEKVAELYGGDVIEWEPQGGGPKAWEVVTNTTRLPIMVPPQPVSQWYEYWTAGGCKHRCDGRTNVLTDELCDPEDYNHLEALKRPTTRLNVVLRDVEGIGVWRIETHGWNAAMELPDAAEFLARAGGYVNGWVALEERTSKAEVPDRQNGGMKIETRHFMVPIIEIDVTPSELMAGRGRVEAPQLEGPVPQSKAIEAPADAFAPYFAEVEAATSLDELGEIWERMKAANLVGTASADSERREEFVAAFRARASKVKPPEAGQPTAAAEPDADGVVEGEIVPDQDDTGGEAGDSNADLPAATEGDPVAVWGEILRVGGEQGMTLGDVEDHFSQEMGGMVSAEASAAELQAYLNKLRSAVPA